MHALIAVGTRVPVEGFPDSTRHKICIRCHKWFEPLEGVVASPESSGPIRSMRNLGAQMTGDSSALRFMCHRIRVRRNTKLVILATFLRLIAMVLILERIGLI